MIHRIVIDSSDIMSELCLIGKNVGADKSPYNTVAHRHPYTAVYSMLLSPLKNKPITFAEIGVAGGRSSLLWKAYFTNPSAKVLMFDRDEMFLENARKWADKRFTFSLMDVSKDGDVSRALSSVAEQYDVIIDDSSHEHGHQIRIIKEAWPLLRSGGTIIIEDIFRSIADEEYACELEGILSGCSASYFVMCEHKDKWSPGWDNDKLLVLVKE